MIREKKIGSMRFLLLILVNLCIQTLSFGQSSQERTSYQLSINTQLNTRFQSYRLGLSRSLDQWEVQLNGGISRLYTDRDPIGWSAGLSSKYIPQFHLKLDFYFISSLDVFSVKRNLSSQDTRRSSVFQGTVGYGFTYKVLPKISFDTSFGLGLLLEHTATTISIGESRTKSESAGLLNFAILIAIE